MTFNFKNLAKALLATAFMTLSSQVFSLSTSPLVCIHKGGDGSCAKVFYQQHDCRDTHVEGCNYPLSEDNQYIYYRKECVINGKACKMPDQPCSMTDEDIKNPCPKNNVNVESN